MNRNQIQQSLLNLFTEKGCRVVFWYDPEASFTAEVNELELDGIEIWRLDEHGPLAKHFIPPPSPFLSLSASVSSVV
jgi:hypothetical protein